MSETIHKTTGSAINNRWRKSCLNDHIGCDLIMDNFSIAIETSGLICLSMINSIYNEAGKPENFNPKEKL